MKSEAVRTFFFENKSKQCLVYGNSMEPYLSYGQEVEIVPCTGPLEKGHCYAFITESTLTIHRFVKMAGKDSAFFAGDNCLFFDRVALSDVVGELSPCQDRGILSIINTINNLFCVLVQWFREILALNRMRRRIVRTIIGFEKERGRGHEKKI
jgi:hypothetical protein